MAVNLLDRFSAWLASGRRRFAVQVNTVQVNTYQSNSTALSNQTMNQLVIVAQDHAWRNGFAVAEHAASMVAEKLNRLAEIDGERDNWLAVSVPLNLEEVRETLSDWLERGL